MSITTGELLVQDGGLVSASTTGEGNAGNLNVNATDSIELIGTAPDGRSGLFASAIIGTGDGGNLTVVTDRFIIQDGATVSVSNFSSLGLSEPGSGSPGGPKYRR